jgi:hypothetical protein
MTPISYLNRSLYLNQSKNIKTMESQLWELTRITYRLYSVLEGKEPGEDIANVLVLTDYEDRLRCRTKFYQLFKKLSRLVCMDVTFKAVFPQLSESDLEGIESTVAYDLILLGSRNRIARQGIEATEQRLSTRVLQIRFDPE